MNVVLPARRGLVAELASHVFHNVDQNRFDLLFYFRVVPGRAFFKQKAGGEACPSPGSEVFCREIASADFA